MYIIDALSHPEYKEKIIDYFILRWSSEDSKNVYIDAINNASIDKANNWYLLMDNNKIVGCAGLISNDFVSRMDLTPFLCALYIEKEYRGKNLGKLLIDKIKEDALSRGFDHLYLVTNHIGYYEHFGFEYFATGYHPWNDSSRIYKANINNNRYTLKNNVEALLDKSLPLVSNLANVSKLLKDGFKDVSWAGFYIVNENYLYLSCYQGPIACSKIELGKGVCGKSAATKKSILVKNVHEFEGHIACSSLTNSEVVVPIIKKDKVVAVIDLDSNEYSNFDEKDVEILQQVAFVLSDLF